ncbi:MAG TPA: PAS domain S-box protein, partial [Pirellulales bacterium]|nr:PAS domain S-box protein [Pirellulales bacterium]
IETVRLHKSGKRIDVALTFSPIFDGEHHLVGISRIVRDIRLQKQADASLRASEERFRSVVESDLIAIAFWSKDGTIVDGNNALLRIIGSTRDELRAGKIRWRDITPKEFWHLDDHAMEELERTGRWTPFDKEYQRADGTRVPVHLGGAWLPGQQIGVGYLLDITRRRRMEQALRRQSHILQSTLDSIGDGVVVANEHGQVLLFNPAAKQILGLGLDQARRDGQTAEHTLDGADGSIVGNLDESPVARAALKGEKIDQLEMYVKHDRVREGMWISVTARPIRDDEDALRGGVAVLRDVTRHKRVEERLARDAQLLANVRDAVIVSDLDGLVTYWNEGARRLFGWTAEEMIGRPLVDRIPADGREAMLRAMGEIVESGEWSGEWHDYHKDGSRLWIDCRVSRVTNRAGEPIGFMGVSHDITARKQAVEELRIRDRAIQAVEQGILITDPTCPDNPITYVSAGFERLTGYAAHEVIGRNCRLLQGPKTDPATVSQLRESMRRGESCSVEILNYRRDGTEFWNELSISPVTEEGRLTHFVGVQNDVTERRLLEEQYRQAQKMEAVGQLAGGVDHDFNNILAVILGYTHELLRSDAIALADREAIAEINKAAERAASLTRKLLGFSRKEVLKFQVLNLNNIVSEMEKMLRRTIGEHVELRTSLASTLRPVKVDPSQIEQVILNLAVNARDAMPDGGMLEITTRNIELAADDGRIPGSLEPGAYVELSVRDSGHGIDPHIADHIFEPFFTTKERGKGTGLGLPFVYGVVKQSNGHVSVASEVGKGTAFTILWPCVAEELSVETAKPIDQGPNTGTEAVLLVEDDDSVRKLLVRTLRSAGYRVFEAGNGGEALDAFRKADVQIDLLVTDVVMPQMSGRALLEQLRKSAPDLKLLYISGYTNDDMLRQGMMDGDVYFLRKPFASHELTAKVRFILDQSR